MKQIYDEIKIKELYESLLKRLQKSMRIRSRRLKPRQQRSDPMFLQEQNKNQGQISLPLTHFIKQF